MFNQRNIVSALRKLKTFKVPLIVSVLALTPCLIQSAQARHVPCGYYDCGGPVKCLCPCYAYPNGCELVEAAKEPSSGGLVGSNGSTGVIAPAQKKSR